MTTKKQKQKLKAKTNAGREADPPPSHPSEQKALAGDPGSAKDDNKKAKALRVTSGGDRVSLYWK
jgi:hypothetical protein